MTDYGAAGNAYDYNSKAQEGRTRTCDLICRGDPVLCPTGFTAFKAVTYSYDKLNRMTGILESGAAKLIPDKAGGRQKRTRARGGTVYGDNRASRLNDLELMSGTSLACGCGHRVNLFVPDSHRILLDRASPRD